MRVFINPQTNGILPELVLSNEIYFVTIIQAAHCQCGFSRLFSCYVFFIPSGITLENVMRCEEIKFLGASERERKKEE